MGYENIFQYLGSYGPYQRRVHLLLCLPCILVAFHRLVGVFLLAVPPHRCKLPYEKENSTYLLPSEMINSSLPWDSLLNSWSQCLRMDTNSSTEHMGNMYYTTQCESWIYDNSVYAKTVVTEHNLVCNRKWLVPTGHAVFMLGDLLGSLLFGSLADKFGRKVVFIIALTLQVFFGLVLAFVRDIIYFMILRIAIGMATAGIFNSSYVIGIELVGPEMRMFAGVAVEFFWCAGYIILTVLAFYIRDWQYLQIAISIPGLLFLCYWWLVPESSRWLMAEGRIDEAKKILQHAANVNKVNLPEEEIINSMKSDYNEQQKNISIMHIWKHRNLCLRSLNIFLNWFAVCSVFYGLSLNTSNLGGNDYLNFLLAGAVEIPAYVVLLLTLNSWGRVPVLSYSVLLASSSMFIIAFVPTDMNWLVITVAMLGKFAVACAFATNFIFTLELFPTIIRTAAVGTGATFARFGSLISPYINMLNMYWHSLSYLIFGGVLLISGLCAFFLPETLNRNLPDTLEDGEKMKNKNEEEIKL